MIIISVIGTKSEYGSFNMPDDVPIYTTKEETNEKQRHLQTPVAV